MLILPTKGRERERVFFDEKSPILRFRRVPGVPCNARGHVLSVADGAGPAEIG